jgi:ABC-type Fe3+ transport system permease subunit
MGVPRVLIVFPLAFLVVFGLAPLALLLAGAFAPAGSFELGAPLELFRGGELGPRLVNSISLAALTACLATALGILPGLAIGRTDLRLKPGWCIVLALPLLLPPVFEAAGWRPWAAAWTALAGRGPVTALAGSTVALTLVTFPVPLFLTALSLRRTDAALEDVARIQRGARRAVRSMVLTLARPGIALGWLLVFLISLSEASIADVFGLPTYQAHVAALQDGAAWRSAGAASLPLLLVALIGAILESRLFGERGVAFLARTTRIETRMLPLGRSAWAVQLLLAALALASFGFPLLGWAIAVRTAGEPEAARILAAAWRDGGPAFARSLVFALAGGTLATAIGVPLAYAAERDRLPARNGIDLLLVLLFVMPGSVMASGLLRVVPAGLFRASAAALTVGLALRVAVVPFRMERVALRRLGSRGEEAGRLAGASWRMRLERLVLPLNAEYLVSLWAAAGLLAFRDGGLSRALSPAAPTLAVLAETDAARSPAELGALAIVTAGLAAATILALALLALLVAAALRSTRAPATAGSPA